MGERPVGSVGTAEYDRLLSLLREARMRAGYSQGALSLRLGRSRTYVDKIERGVRRIDVLEFCHFAFALRIDPKDLFAAFADSAFSEERSKNIGPDPG